MSDRQGFTLAELLVALAVLAILSAVGVPYVLTFAPGFRVGGAARQVLADMRLAKTMAVERGRDVFIRFNSPGTNEYAMRLDTDGSSNLSAGDEVLKTVSLPALYSGIEFGTMDPQSPPADGITFPGNVAVFHPEKGASGGTVYLRPARDAAAGRRDRERKITVIVSTGRAKADTWPWP